MNLIGTFLAVFLGSFTVGTLLRIACGVPSVVAMALGLLSSVSFLLLVKYWRRDPAQPFRRVLAIATFAYACCACGLALTSLPTSLVAWSGILTSGLGLLFVLMRPTRYEMQEAEQLLRQEGSWRE
jgi:hypothetical protein